MVVFAIVALLAAGSVRGFRSLRKADLRESSMQLSGAMRYLFDRASTTGRIHRLVIDMEQGMYWAEVSDDRFYIPREETERDMRKREDKEADDDEEVAKKAERAAKETENGHGPAAGSSFDLSKLEVGDFRPKRARFASFKDLALKPVHLKKGTKVQSVYTPRVTEPLTSGRSCAGGQECPGTHCLFQGQSGQDQYGVERHWESYPRIRRVVQDDDRR